jgi:hypothetical protein
MLETRNVESEERAAGHAVERGGRLHWLALLSLGFFAVGLYYWGRDLHRFTQWLAAYIGLYTAELAIYSIACWLVWRWPKANGRRSASMRAVAIIAFAVAFRLVLLSQQPFLSADVYRYIWDGRVQTAGINPYRFVPADPQLDALRDEKIFNAIPPTDRQWISPYPPVAQAIFYISYRIWHSSVGGFKAMMSLFDLLSMLALVAVLIKEEKDPARVVVFAWHPLLVYESAHSGHVEAVYIACIALALAAWSFRQRAGAGALIGAATLVKFYPALLLPAFGGADDCGGESATVRGTRTLWSRARAVLLSRATAALTAGFLVAALVFWLPYSGAGLRVFGFLNQYVADEGFGGQGSRYVLLELMREVVAIPTTLFVGVAATVMLLAVVRALVRVKAAPSDLASACLTLIGTYLMITSPRYAWYYAWLLPFLCLSPRLGWLYLASASALLYLVWYTPLVYPNIPAWLGCAVYLPALGLLAYPRMAAMLRRPTLKVLDQKRQDA